MRLAVVAFAFVLAALLIYEARPRPRAAAPISHLERSCPLPRSSYNVPCFALDEYLQQQWDI